MGKYQMHKEHDAQVQYEYNGATYIICVCGEYMKVTYKGCRKAEEGEDDGIQ